MNNFSLKAMPFDAEIITNPQTGQEEYDRVAHSKELADLIRAYFSNGILVQGADLLTNELQVLHLSAMSCVVKPGGIIINGRTGFLENEQTMEFDVGTQNPRIDRVVAELNITERNIYIRVLKGVAEADPKPAAITQTEDIYQIPLAQVRVNANQSVIANVKDERAGYISNVLLNQAPSKDIVASTVGISDEVRSLYGLSVDNANVDKALHKIWNDTHNYVIETITSTRSWTAPDGVDEIDIVAIGGGSGGGSGGIASYSQIENVGYFQGNPGRAGGIVLAKLSIPSNARTFSLTIGSGGIGGASVFKYYGDTASKYGNIGTAGGDTTVSISGLTLLTALGGEQNNVGLNNKAPVGSTGSAISSIFSTITQGGNSGYGGTYPSGGNAGTISAPAFIKNFPGSISTSGGGIGGYAGSRISDNGVGWIDVQGPGTNGGPGAGNGGNGGVFSPTLVTGNNGTDATSFGCGGGSGSNVGGHQEIRSRLITSGKGGNGKQGVIYIGYYKAV